MALILSIDGVDSLWFFTMMFSLVLKKRNYNLIHINIEMLIFTGIPNEVYNNTASKCDCKSCEASVSLDSNTLTDTICS